ncbi:G-protein coupled receptor 39 [Pleurodeles waltl]|uniref:G-protein coupled receptor 39 n=1 Tax=Pleurodeles waltl TaxID=8319 RepID=UPI003709837E
MGQQSDVDPCDLLLGHEHVPDFEMKFWIKITLTVLYSLIMLAGVLGNSITIQTCKILQKKGYMQKGVTDHMISLACSDLLVILLGMPVELYSVIWYPLSSTHGNITCKAYCFLFEACSYTTVFHVATLSFERYIAICHPFKFKSISGTCTVKLMICFAWFTSVCVALPFIFAMGAEYPLEPVVNYKGAHNCSRPSMYHLFPGGPQSNVTLCTPISSKWVVFQSSIFCAFIVYILILGSVAFMCRNMMKVLMSSKKGTVTVKGSRGNNMDCMTKTTSTEAKSARKQTIVFLGKIQRNMIVFS